MKCALILSNLCSSFGGNYVASLAALQSLMRERGWRLIVAFPNAAAERNWISVFDEVHLFELTNKSLTSLFDWACSQGVDVIHYNFLSWPQALMCKRALRGRIKTVVHFHMHEEMRGKVSDVARLTLRKRAWSDAVLGIAVSNAVRTEVSRIIGNKRVTTIYNGIDFSRLNASNEIERKIDDDVVNCIIMGNSYRNKGVDLAAKALLEVSHSGTAGRLYVITSANSHEIESYLTESLGDEAVDAMSLVELLPPSENVGAYFKAMDVFLSPSRSEAFGVSADEAAWLGVPGILTDVPGQSENRVPCFRWVGNPSHDNGVPYDMSRLINELASQDDCERVLFAKASQIYLERMHSLNDWTNLVMSAYEWVADYSK